MKRIAYYKTKEVMNNYKIPILIGLRRVGKTTILNQIESENKKESKIIRFDSLEIRGLKTIEIKKYINNLIMNGIRIFLFDEIQVREDWFVLAKDLFDEYVVNKKIKIVITGSSSLRFEKVDTGVDRTQKVLISTLDFHEYLELKNKESSYEEFEKYLGAGPYPEYVNQELNGKELAMLTLEPILNDDIPSQYSVSANNVVRLLFELSSLTNGEFNKARSSKNTGISINQINNYLDILEKAQIIKMVYKVDEKGNQPRYPIFKVYINPHFHLWLLNKNFNEVEDKAKGHIVESYWLFASTQIDGYYKRFYYLKTKDGHEIDFVSLNPSGNPVFKTLHEFKYTKNPIVNNIFKTIPSLNKVIWSKKESHKDLLIKYENIIDFQKEF